MRKFIQCKQCGRKATIDPEMISDGDKFVQINGIEWFIDKVNFCEHCVLEILELMTPHHRNAYSLDNEEKCEMLRDFGMMKKPT